MNQAIPEANSPQNFGVSLHALAAVFFRLGTIGFGGPAAHIAMMEEETVKRRKWLTHEQFLDLLGATNLIPGPNSTEMAIHVGYVKAGWRGLAVAGTSFIFPAVAITLLFSFQNCEVLPWREVFWMELMQARLD